MQSFFGFLRREWFRLSIVVMGLIVIIMVGNYFERQRMDEALQRMEKTSLEKQESNKAYIAKRRNDCFDIYDKEKGNWTNVTGSRYDEDSDVCYVSYKDAKNTKTKEQCEKDFTDPGTGKFYSYTGVVDDYLLCVSHEFEKPF